MKTIRILLLAIIGILFAASCDSNINPFNLIQVGEKVPDFDLTAVNGDQYTPEVLMSNGTAFSIITIKPDCDACKRRLAQVNNVMPEGYPILIFSDGNEEDTMKDLAEIDVAMPVVTSVTKELIYKFTQITYPALYIFNKNGICQSRIRTEMVKDEDLLKYLNGTPFPE